MPTGWSVNGEGRAFLRHRAGADGNAQTDRMVGVGRRIRALMPAAVDCVGLESASSAIEAIKRKNRGSLNHENCLSCAPSALGRCDVRRPPLRSGRGYRSRRRYCYRRNGCRHPWLDPYVQPCRHGYGIHEFNECGRQLPLEPASDRRVPRDRGIDRIPDLQRFGRVSQHRGRAPVGYRAGSWFRARDH